MEWKEPVKGAFHADSEAILYFFVALRKLQISVSCVDFLAAKKMTMKPAAYACTMFFIIALGALSAICIAYNDAKRNCGVGDFSAHQFVYAQSGIVLVVLLATFVSFVGNKTEVFSGGCCTGQCLLVSGLVFLKIVADLVLAGIGIAINKDCGENARVSQSIGLSWFANAICVSAIWAAGEL